jgi:hypothetical protein
MAKKHCERHYRYVANCPACRAANSSGGNEGSADDERRLYQDVDYDDLEEDNEIPVRPRAQIPKDDPYGGNRYHYSTPRSQNGKKILVISVFVVAIATLITVLYAFPLWYAKISLQNQLYSEKAGINFWSIYSMNLWSTQFFFNKIGLIGGLIGAIIFSLPPETTLMALIGTKTGWGRPSPKKALIINWTVGFAFFYLVGQALDTGYFAYIMFSLEQGTMSYDFSNPFRAMLVLYDTHSVTMMDIFIYNNLVNPIVTYIFVLLILRAVINIINNAYLFQNKFKVTSNILYIIGLIFGASYFAYPLQPLDGLVQIQSFSVLIGFFGFLVIGMVIEGVGKNNARQNRFEFDSATRHKTVVTAAIIIGLIVVPLFISIPTAIAIDNDQKTWTEQRWGVQIEREVEWTRVAAGLYNNFQEYGISNYTDSVITSDLDMVKSIRQYDRVAAGKKMANVIGTTYEILADSDIIYIDSGIAKGEYWVAPKTINVAGVATTAVRRHTEMYDHVEGFLSLDTFTGELVNDSQYKSFYGIDADYPIFFGEEHDISYDSSSATTDLFANTYSLKAYEDDILLYTEWTNSSTDMAFKHRYTGKPDGNLTGLEAFWFTLNMGLTQDALKGGEKSYLINRNIKTRVGNALLPGMFYDPDPYLVFDRENGRMYYAVSIISSIQIGSFAKSPLYRFLGVCLVDVKTGDLTWVRNFNLDTVNDPLYQMYKVHVQFYNWQQISDTNLAFLKNQMRYPEKLWSNQLSYDYTYHVRDALTFYGGNDFYEEPDNTVPYYIETDLGEGLEYVAVQIVEYMGEDAVTLAGIYIVRHGENLGETRFYKVPKQQTIRPIGPGIAQREYGSQATQELALIQNRRDGNILLYPIADSLYYFIPTYSAPSGTERLQLAGLVNAFTKTVGYGSDAIAAYFSLNITSATNTTKDEKIQLNIEAPSEIVYNANSWGTIKANILSTETNDTLDAQNLTLQLKIYGVNASVKLFNQNILPVNGTNDFGVVYNYTLANFLLNPQQGIVYPIRITKDPEGLAAISFFYQVVLLEYGIPVVQSEIATMTVKNSGTP